MPISTISSREYNQDSGRAKRAASKGIVFITERGKRSHVMMSIKEYNRLAGNGMSLAEALAMPGGDEHDFEFEPAKLGNEMFRPAEFD